MQHFEKFRYKKYTQDRGSETKEDTKFKSTYKVPMHFDRFIEKISIKKSIRKIVSDKDKEILANLFVFAFSLYRQCNLNV